MLDDVSEVTPEMVGAVSVLDTVMLDAEIRAAAVISLPPILMFPPRFIVPVALIVPALKVTFVVLLNTMLLLIRREHPPGVMRVMPL